jgi:hypothetical protein
VDVFNLGQKVRIAAVFSDEDGVEADPSAVYAVVKEPGEAAVTYTYGTDAELVRDSVGNYHLDQGLETAGIWAVRWHSTGNVQAGSADTLIRVRETVCD